MDNFNYQVVQPQSSVNNKSIATANTHIFTYNAASNETVNLNKSFFNVHLKVHTHAPLATTFATTLLSEGLSQGMQFAAFASSEFYTNNVLCDRINNFISHNVSKLFMNSSSDFAGATSPFLLPETAGFETSRAPQLLRINNVKRIVNVATSTTGTELGFTYSSDTLAQDFHLLFSIPFPHLSNASSDMLGNCNYTCKLQSNGNAIRDIFSGLVPANRVETTTVVFESMAWTIPTFRTTIPSSLTASYLYSEIYSYVTNLTSDNYQINIPANTNMILVYFSYATSSNLLAPGAGTTDTTVPATCTLRYDTLVQAADATSPALLQSLYINFAGNNYPNDMYNFSNKIDYMRAFQTYVRNSGAFSLGEVPLVKSFETFMRYPVFPFKVSSSTNTNVGGQQNLTVYAKTHDATRVLGIQLNVACFGDKSLEVEYGEYGQIVSTNVMINA